MQSFKFMVLPILFSFAMSPLAAQAQTGFNFTVDSLEKLSQGTQNAGSGNLDF